VRREREESFLQQENRDRGLKNPARRMIDSFKRKIDKGEKRMQKVND
jgi:hypothetical protein